MKRLTLIILCFCYSLLSYSNNDNINFGLSKVSDEKDLNCIISYSKEIDKLCFCVEFSFNEKHLNSLNIINEYVLYHNNDFNTNYYIETEFINNNIDVSMGINFGYCYDDFSFNVMPKLYSNYNTSLLLGIGYDIFSFEIDICENIEYLINVEINF